MHTFTSSLFHYTKQRKILVSILKQGLLPNYCKEQFNSNNQTKTVIGIPMISFCDIPIMRAHDFSTRYGRYAIAFTKDWALKNQINPILYVQNKDFDDAMNFLWLIESYFSQMAGTDGDTISISFNPNESQSFPQIAALINFIQTQQANNTFMGFTKRYQMNREGKIQNNYEENEWRYIVKEDKKSNITWLRGEGNYNQWRGNKKNKPKPTKEMLNHKLTFKVNDITHLITSSEKDTDCLIKDIRKMKKLCGIELTELDKDLLINKVISFEKIDKDF